MDRPQSRHRVILKPVAEKVSVFLESKRDVLAQFESQLVHLVIMLIEELFDPLVLLLGWEWGFLVEWQSQGLI